MHNFLKSVNHGLSVDKLTLVILTAGDCVMMSYFQVDDVSLN